MVGLEGVVPDPGEIDSQEPPLATTLKDRIDELGAAAMLRGMGAGTGSPVTYGTLTLFGVTLNAGMVVPVADAVSG